MKKPLNIKKFLLPNIPYVFIALFATKLGQAWRLAPGMDFSEKALHLMEGFAAAFQSALPSFHPIDLCVGVAAALLIRLIVYVKGKNAKKFRKNLEYGSARWGRLGGGLLRDMTLQVGNVYILNQPMALPLSIATAAIIYIFPAIVDKPEKLIPLLDIISVGIYAATGADKALVYGFAPAVCIMMGFFTAVGGGMLRDGFMGVVPGIFQRTNFYAIAAIAGSASYVCLVMSGLVSNVVALVVCVVVTMGLRWLSLRFDIKSPTEDDIARFLHRKK